MEQKRFYERLYQSSLSDCDENLRNEFLSPPNLKTLDENQSQACEGLLSKEECFKALSKFSINKTPGTDGLSAEFYRFFWSELGEIMVNSFNYSLKKGEMSISQKQGIINLIPKKKKNPLLLENWRPISLLNTDYKVDTKAIANRIEKVLPSIINPNQTGYV